MTRVDFGELVDWFRGVAKGGAWADVAIVAGKKRGRKSSPPLRDDDGRVDVVHRVRAALVTRHRHLSEFSNEPKHFE